jgi:hypothetical protein
MFCWRAVGDESGSLSHGGATLCGGIRDSMGKDVTVDGRKTVWADDKTNLDAWFHPVGPGSINPHRMKDDKGYIMVAACYGPNGAR